MCILGSHQRRRQEFIRGRDAFQGEGAACAEGQSSEMPQYLENVKSAGKMGVYSEEVGWAILRMRNLKLRELNELRSDNFSFADSRTGV